MKRWITRWKYLVEGKSKRKVLAELSTGSQIFSVVSLAKTTSKCRWSNPRSLQTKSLKPQKSSLWMISLTSSFKTLFSRKASLTISHKMFNSSKIKLLINTNLKRCSTSGHSTRSRTFFPRETNLMSNGTLFCSTTVPPRSFLIGPPWKSLKIWIEISTKLWIRTIISSNQVRCSPQRERW